jgi:hypothetical protein
MKHPATAVVLMLAATLAPSATAAKGPHTAPSTSSIAQYVEQLPSASGSVAVGRGSGATARLAPAAQKALSKSGGGDASTLQKIAADSQAGAPARTPSTRASVPRASEKHHTTKAGQSTAKAHQSTAKAQQRTSKAVGPAPPAHTPTAVSAAASTFGVNSLLALGIVLAGITAVAALFLRRQRQ